MAATIAILCGLGIAAIVFYKTIMTREWRNKAPAEADSWHWLVFYFNPKDERLFLPKRTGLGWTINFGQRLAIVMAVLLVVGVVAFVVALITA